MLSFSALLGLLVGGAIGVYREIRDRVFRVAQQVRDELGLKLIGMLPAISFDQTTVAKETSNPKHVQVTSPLQRYVIDAPLSVFAEALRGAKVEVDLAYANKRPKTIGIASVLNGEGKTTISKNWASLLASLGSKTLLIDGDMRNPNLTRKTARHAPFGLLEVLRGEHPLEEALVTEPETGLCVLPAVVTKRLLLSSELISSKAMEQLLEKACTHFDYIIVDLPPIGPVVDVRAAAHLFDGFILVVEWGKTARSVVKSAMTEDEILFRKCIGIIYNKVDVAKLKLYDHCSSKTYIYRSVSTDHG